MKRAVTGVNTFLRNGQHGATRMSQEPEVFNFTSLSINTAKVGAALLHSDTAAFCVREFCMTELIIIFGNSCPTKLTVKSHRLRNTALRYIILILGTESREGRRGQAYYVFSRNHKADRNMFHETKTCAYYIVLILRLRQLSNLFYYL
jgi:hypothetical protein